MVDLRVSDDTQLPSVPLLDVASYVDEFNSEVVDAYQHGTADRDLPADAAVARSIIPPGTAAARDFSGLSPQLPAFVAERCVGCMTCVTSCPDAAIIGIVRPNATLEAEIGAFAATEAEPERAKTTARTRFAETKKYGEVLAKRGIEPGSFGIFVDPHHCKGCAECVEVCHALGYDALFMTDKDRRDGGDETVLQQAERDLRFFHTLAPTPPEYRNERALADIMLGENAFGYVGGAGSCPGCGEATSVRMMVAATRQAYGPEAMAIVAATGCNTVYGSTYPYNPYLVPWTNSLFENAPAVAMGVRSRWNAAGHADRKVWVLGGDGAMYDIGFQALSRLVASGADVNVLVLDTQVYSNTGGQASTASFGGQVTKLSAFGKAIHGRPEQRKELGRILLAHGGAYVAQTTPAHINHFYRSIMEANEYPGPSVVIAYTPCQPEHGIADDASMRQAKLAVDSRAYPLFSYDPRRGPSVAERLSLQGNPALRADWETLADGSETDFLTFARTEGRFAPHFAADGTPSVEMLAVREERLANWRTLQELAGLR